MDETMKFYARKEPWKLSISLYLAQKRGERIAVAQPVQFVETDPYITGLPMLELDVKEAQRLMDELWDCGLRPSEGSGSAGALAATQRHLDDMRRLVFRPITNDDIRNTPAGGDLDDLRIPRRP